MSAEADGRCDYFSTDVVTTGGRPRVDGWRCGDSQQHKGGHTLYSLDGEQVLYSATWAKCPRSSAHERRPGHG